MQGGGIQPLLEYIKRVSSVLGDICELATRRQTYGTTLVERIIGMLIAASISATQAHAERAPTLKDARTISEVSSLVASADGSHILYVYKGHVVIADAKAPGIPLVRLAGDNGQWSPDGRLVAFFVYPHGYRQLCVWSLADRRVVLTTNVPNGISPNLWTMGDAYHFSFSPDSSRIAFVSRIMPNFLRIGRSIRESQITTVTNWTNTRFAVLSSLLRTDPWHLFYPSKTSDFGDYRMRAIERDPELSRSHLFILDLASKKVAEVRNKAEITNPSWSPRGNQLAVTITTKAAPDFTVGYPQTQLAFLNPDTGAVTSVETPFHYNGTPHWSYDGTQIALSGQERSAGFAHVAVYDTDTHYWRTLGLPGGHSVATGSALDMAWANHGPALFVRARDRLVYKVWKIDPTGRASTVNTGDANVLSFSEGQGSIYYVADGGTYEGRLFRTRQVESPELLWDANPQLRYLTLGAQRRIAWTNSRGDEVDGILILPVGYRAPKRYPLIIDAYPWKGIDDLKLAASSQIMGQLQAAEGYAILFANARTPHGGYEFPRDETYTEHGVGAKGVSLLIDDISSAVRYLSDAGLIDPKRVGVFGHSNGGYVANFLITESRIARCAVISAGFNNALGSVFGYDPPGSESPLMARDNWQSVYEDFHGYATLSPLFRMNQVSAPVLLLSGDHDYDWTLSTMAEYNSLRLLGKQVIWRRYRDEGHFFTKPGDVQDALSFEMHFFDDCLK